LIRNPFLQALATGAFLLSLSGCAEAPVKIGDGKIEKPLEQATGLTTDDVTRASQKAQLNLWDVYALAVERTELLASNQENVEQAHAQSQQAVGAWLPQVFLSDTKNWQSNGYVFGEANPYFVPLDNALSLSVTESLLTGLNQVAAVQGAQATVDFQNYNVKNAAATLLTIVAQDFYNVLQLQDALQTEQASRDLTGKTLDQEKSWQAIGRAQKSDVLSTEAQLAQVVATLGKPWPPWRTSSPTRPSSPTTRILSPLPTPWRRPWPRWSPVPM
jgi:outer membrane protein TolC